MEPRRDDGDDKADRDVVDALKAAAMEPRRDDGDDVIVTGRLRSRSYEPQWSPVVTTGTTARRIRAA